jgi:hypothetical protein
LTQTRSEWRLFNDSLKISLKAVLLYNRNKFQSVTQVHGADIKESYENMKLLLGKIQDEKYNWKICGDLKVNALFEGHCSI